MRLAILVLAVSATAYGQEYNQRVMSAQNQNLPAESNLTIGTIPGPPSLAKCGKYEHADPVQWACSMSGCSWTTPKCVDDVHVVTEKEWQTLLTLAAEKPRDAGSANERERQDDPLRHPAGGVWRDNFIKEAPMGVPPFKDNEGNFVLGVTGPPEARFTGCLSLNGSGANLPSYQGASEKYRCDQGEVIWTWAANTAGNTIELATPTPGTKLPPDGSLTYAGGARSIESLTSSVASAVVLATVGSMERIELPTTGDVILIAYNKEGKRTLTVYRDGHVLAEGADPDEITKYFWKLFADTERTALPACKR
jgi:hypothetical protein